MCTCTMYMPTHVRFIFSVSLCGWHHSALRSGTQVLQRPKQSAVLDQEATSVDPDVQEEESKLQVGQWVGTGQSGWEHGH